MPPRKSSSPARKSPAAPSAAPKASPKPSRASKSPARGSAKKAAASASDSVTEEVAAVPSNGSAAATSASNGNGSAKPGADTPAAAPAADSSRGGDCSLLLGIVVVVVALLAGAALYPLTPAQKKVGFISDKVFDGQQIKPSTDKYAGSRLIIFTEDPKTCEPCATLKRELLDAPAFQSKHGEWHANGVLRIGKVNCSKYAALCSRFDVKPPHILWFKDKQKVGSYDGEYNAEALTKWVLSMQDTGEL